MKFRLILPALIALCYLPLSPLFAQPSPAYHINTFTISNDGTLLAIAGRSIEAADTVDHREYPIDIYDVATGDFVETLENVWPMPDKMAFSPDNSMIAYSTLLGSANVIDLGTGKTLYDFFGYGMVAAVGVDWTSVGSRVAAANRTTIDIINPVHQSQGAGIFPIGTDQEFVALAWSPNGLDLATATNDGQVQIWDTVVSAPPLLKSFFCDHSTSLDWSPTGGLLAANSQKDVIVFDVDKGKIVSVFSLGDEVNTVAWSYDGQTIAAGTTSGIEVIDYLSRQVTLSYSTEDSVYRVAWSPEGNLYYEGTQSDNVISKDGKPYLTPLLPLSDDGSSEK